MVVGLVPYQWKTVGGMSFWTLPDGVTSAIDLRRIDQITDKTATGYAIAIYPDELPDGSVALDTGNTTRDRDAWLTTLGYRPAGSNAVEWAWSHLMDGADDQFAAACRPLRGGRRGRIEMHLGGKHERALSHTERLVQAVLVRRDLDVIFDDVQAGRLPAGMHRKALQAYADDLGIDPLTLRSKAARWRNETPLRPTTSITDEGWSGTSQSLAAYGWTVLGNAAHTWNTGSDVFVFHGASASNSGLIAFHPTALSTSNMLTTAITQAAGDYCGPFARGSGSTNSNWSGYGCDNFAGEATLQLFAFVSSSPTLLGQDSSGSTPYTQRIQAIDSTIKASDNNSAWRLTYTNTAVTSGLRAGLWGWGGPYADVTINTFSANDYVAPTVTNNSASGAYGDGGTVQMSATESPTSWSLTGSPPTGVSIDNAGLVTWTGSTPAAVHSVGVRATNATGNGDGTLTLTITAAISSLNSQSLRNQYKRGMLWPTDGM